mmetsp:Transcript_16571/g.45163  ORF Transcript_16571/g.45163 Transcript_16571/m.45163 type:complete len:94 (+) Transcript_16571:364-645(+)
MVLKGCPEFETAFRSFLGSCLSEWNGPGSLTECTWLAFKMLSIANASDGLQSHSYFRMRSHLDFVVADQKVALAYSKVTKMSEGMNFQGSGER